jgi:hypothetical protein
VDGFAGFVEHVQVDPVEAGSVAGGKIFRSDSRFSRQAFSCRAFMQCSRPGLRSFLGFGRGAQRPVTVCLRSARLLGLLHRDVAATYLSLKERKAWYTERECSHMESIMRR